jgi:Ser/Thr protein kinase RdoA (MazF antagonist)
MDQKIIQKAEALFGVDASAPIVSLRESSDNAVFVVEKDGKKKVLRLSKRLPIEDVVFEYEAIDHLAKGGVLVPRFLPALSGEYYVVADGVVAVLFDFIEGHHAKADKDHFPTVQQVFEAGKGLAGVHNIGRSFKPSSPRRRTIFSELERALSLEKVFIEQFEGGKDFIDQVKMAIEFGNAHLKDVGLIHNDYRTGNVFFDDAERLVGIIDFDWSCLAPIMKDIALGVLEWSFVDGTAAAPNFKIFDSFLDGYNSVADVKQEKDSELYNWITFAALSDAATYFCDRVEDPSTTKRIGSSYMYRKYQFFLSLSHDHFK